MRVGLSGWLLLGAALAGCGGAAQPASPAASTAAKPSAASAAAPSAAAKPSASAAGSAAAKPAAGLTKVTVGYGNVSGDYVPLWVAKEAGIFEKNGIDADLQFLNGGQNAMAAFVAGQVQVGEGGGAEDVSAAVGGVDTVILSTTVPVYPYKFYVPPSIKTPEDLKGKTVDIASHGGSADIATRAVFKKIGLDPDKDVTLVTLGTHATGTAALLSGSVQGKVDNLPAAAELESHGFHAIFDLAALKLPTANMTTRVQRSFLTANHDLMQRYVDSTVEAMTRIRKDKPFTLGIMKKYFKLDDDPAVSATYDFYVNEVYADAPYATPEQFNDIINTLSQTNEKVRGFDVSKLIDSSFVKSSIDRGLNK